MRLTLNLTHACNLACSYCFAGEARQQKMPAAVGRSSIDWAIRKAAASAEPNLEISFMGGEPLLALDLLLELASHALVAGAAAGVSVRFQTTTNGTLLDDVCLARLAPFVIDLAVSIDGLADVHDRIRRTRGGAPTGAAVWRALDRAVGRCRSVSVVCVVTPASVDGLADAIRAFAAHGVRRISLNPDWTSIWEDSDLERWRRAYLEAADVYLSAYREGSPFALNLFDEKIDLHVRGSIAATFGCGSDPDDIAVAPSGRLYGCGRSIGEDRSDAGSCGDILASLTDAMNCESLAVPTVPDECASCAHRFRCASRCACANRESSGNAGTPGDVICWHEKMVIPLADSVAATLFAEANPAFLLRFYGLEWERHDAAATSYSL